MATIVLKDASGTDYHTSAGVVSLSGAGVINTVTAAQLKALKEIEGFNTRIDKGFVTIGSSKNATDDVKQDILDKQTSDMNTAASATGVEIKKD